jgi:hypothetical protein
LGLWVTRKRNGGIPVGRWNGQRRFSQRRNRAFGLILEVADDEFYWLCIVFLKRHLKMYFFVS